MTKEVCVFLANGFEEIEGLTVVDLLRRADVKVCTVSITKELLIQGAHGIKIYADTLLEDEEYHSVEMMVLPGGMPGTLHLGEHEGLKTVLDEHNAKKKYIAAICAAPTILGKYGYLRDKKATCYPGMENKLDGAIITKEAVVSAGYVITSRGLGTAIPFSLALIEILRGKEKAIEIKNSIVCIN